MVAKTWSPDSPSWQYDPDAPALVLVTHHVEEIPPGFTHAMLLRDGAVVAQGLLAETLTGDNLCKTFGLPLRGRTTGDRLTARAAGGGGPWWERRSAGGRAADPGRRGRQRQHGPGRDGDRAAGAGETVLGTDFVMVPGGKGANQAVAAPRRRRRTFLGAIGSDPFGATPARIAAAGVDTTHLRVVYGASGVALVMVNAPGRTP